MHCHTKGLYISLWCYVFIIFSSFYSSQSNSAVEEICIALQPQTAQVINNFSQNLISLIGGNGNLIFSPFTLSIALGMLYLGARGNTAEQIKNAMHYSLLQSNNTVEGVHEHFHSLLVTLNETNGEYELFPAARLFSQLEYAFREEYLQKLKAYYDAEQEIVDFAQNGGEAIRKINEWVDTKTNGKIPELFQNPLDPSTVMVLLNAVYFKGLWEIPFHPLMTQNDVFHGVNGDKEIPFMEFRERVHYFFDSDTNYHFLELKYQGNHISMIFALPDSINGAPDLELNTNMLCKIRAGFRKRLTNVIIPKFKLNYDRTLIDDFKLMGMTDMFEDTANFTGMRNEADMYISLIKHKAVIELNEIGSEASAASAFVGSVRTMFHGPYFTADHPFLFFILDKRTGCILFLGRFMDP
ncbi:Plasminogen activator inhibitor 2, partial [Stegodyphus mimosarum]